MWDFFSHLFDTSSFMPRWNCGDWSKGHGWLHILSDLGVWSAYVAIPCVLGFFILRRRDLPFRTIFLLFVAFILACGTTHLMEAIIFWWPAYRLAGLIKLMTAVISWATVLALIPVTPQVLAMRSPKELEREIKERMTAEAALRNLQVELESRVQKRTAELENANAALQAEIEQRGRVEESLREQREWFRVTLSSIGDGVIVTDATSRVTFMNSVAQFLTGWSQEEAHERPLEQVFQINDAESGLPAEAPSTKVIREGVASHIGNHVELVSKTLTKRQIEEMAAPIRGTKGAIEGVVLVFRDITERRKKEEEIRESENRFHTLADSIPQLAWSTRPDGHIAWYNQRWYDYTGTTPQEVEGWGWQSLHDPAELPRVLKKWKESLAKEEPWEDTFPLRRRDGAMRWHLSRAVPVKDESDKVAFWFGTNTDITEILELEKALKEADRRKNEFLATLAHELRNPLSPISYALKMWPFVENEPGKTEELLAMMERQVQQMIRLIDDLMDVSRITRGKIQLRRQQVDLASLVSRAVEANQPIIEQRGHQLTVKVPNEPVHLLGDAARLTQVFGNILHNAAKYTGKNGVISVTAEKCDDLAIVRIKDNGPGIPQHMLTEIFEMFRQVDQTIDRSFGGLGIGLTLAKRLIELHGGTIEAYSDGEGKGSEFVISLPTLWQSSAEADEMTGTPRIAINIPPHKILVVDDARESGNMLALMLNSMNQRAHVVYDGPSALAWILAHHPDVVLLDIAMPGMNGYEVARQVREKHPSPVIFLVAVTGYGQQEDQRKAKDAGFDYHLTKPVNMENLEQVLRTIPNHSS